MDPSRPLSFTFDGRRYSALAGDTLASALLANGVRVVARSFKYHRPRGIVALGLDEPNALVCVEAPGARPLVSATMLPVVEGLRARSVHGWPGARFDLGALIGLFGGILPAGFYYKTFMSPAWAWPVYERVLRGLAGLGRVGASEGDDARVRGVAGAVRGGAAGQGADAAPVTGSRRFAHADVVVVGAGPAGLAAALAAARAGARVMLADERPRAGGALRDAPVEARWRGWLDDVVAELDAMPGVRRLADTQVFGFHDHGMLVAREDAGRAGGRLWKIRARQVVIATGAFERPMLFPDNDRPGVMLASAVTGYLHRYGVACGRRVLLACRDDSAYGQALVWRGAGLAVAAIADERPDPPSGLVARVRAAGIEVLPGFEVERVRGRRGVRGARLASIERAGLTREVDCDLIAMAGGWNPVVHLHSQSGGRVVYDEARACFLPGAPAQATRCAGAVDGTFDTAACAAQGAAAGSAAAQALGLVPVTIALPAAVEGADGEGPSPAGSSVPVVTNGSEAGVAGGPSRAPRGWRPEGRARRAFVDMANDVRVDDIALAQREGFASVELVKRYTTAGMGVDQGKSANVHVIGVLAGLRGCTPQAVGTTTFRPPFSPVPFGVIAGGDPGPLVRPVRRTPMTAWHEERGAVMYESGAHWRRPGYYPRSGESMVDAVARECRAVRERVGLYDSTPLGKIEVAGPGAAGFLDLVYACRVATLKPGRGRYGLMLREDGRLLDDGVVFNAGGGRFWVSTTAGNADAVLAWLEQVRQRIWLGAPVFVVPVGSQWANAVVCGPRARDVLAAAGVSIDLDRTAFPFMAMRDGVVAGLPARIFRVSFTGELSFEINVPARHGAALWTALLEAGQVWGIEPVGSEANHVLRVEKGYVSIGHEADGMATPDDLGLDWCVDHGKDDFIGKRGLALQAGSRGPRRQLVGLLTDDPSELLAEGAQILDAHGTSSVGTVTASVASGVLGRTVALALLEDGRRRTGESVRVTVATGRGLGHTTARVGPPVFYDPQGERLRG